MTPFHRRCTVCALALFALVAAVVVGCRRHEAESTEKPPLVRVRKPEIQKVVDYVYFTGRTEAPDSVQVRARVTGYLVPWKFDPDKPEQEYGFVPGQDVKANQKLFKIDPRPYQATYDQALGQLAIAEAQLKLAKANYARALAVAKTPGAISQQDVDRYAAEESSGVAQVQAATANVESAKLNLDFTDVLSPVAGVVSRNLLSVGNLVNADTTQLTSVVSEDPMYVYFDVDERTLLRVQKLLREGKFKGVREGGKVPVDIGLATDAKEYPYAAPIDFVNNQVDPSTGTLQVRGVLDNPKPDVGPRQFAPGLFVRVRVPIGDAHDALVVPQAAIGTDQGNRYVLVIDSQNVVEYRPIDVGAQLPGGLQEAIPIKIVRERNGIRPAGPTEQGEDSLTTGDQIIVGGLQRVRPGAKVQVRQDEPEPK